MENETASTQVARKIFTEPKFASTYLRLIKKEYAKSQTLNGGARKLLRLYGFETTKTEDVQESMTAMMQNSLLPWTNKYYTKLGKFLDINGIADPPVVLWGHEVIKNSKFENGCLTWETADGNDSNGEVYFNYATKQPTTKRITTISFRGSIWTDGETKPELDDLNSELSPPPSYSDQEIEEDNEWKDSDSETEEDNDSKKTKMHQHMDRASYTPSFPFLKNVGAGITGMVIYDAVKVLFGKAKDIKPKESKTENTSRPEFWHKKTEKKANSAK